MRAQHRLPNYLRTYRKRSGFSQEDLAFLLGVRSGAKVSRYERFARLPGLPTALAYEAIFQVPMRELFGGVYQRIEQLISARAGLLLRKKAGAKPARRILVQCNLLKTISSPAATRPANRS